MCLCGGLDWWFGGSGNFNSINLVLIDNIYIYIYINEMCKYIVNTLFGFAQNGTMVALRGCTWISLIIVIL